MKEPHKPRVLMLLENNSFPGDVRVRREAEALSAAGYQVSVIAPAKPGQPAREAIEGIQVRRFPAPPSGGGLMGYLLEYGWSMVATFVLSLQVFLEEGFDVIHAANPPDTFVLVAAPYKLLGKRFIFDHHDLSPEMYYARMGGEGSRIVYWVLLQLEKLSCGLADHVIATNQSYKRLEMERHGVPEEKVTIVRNGPDFGAPDPREPDPSLRPEGKSVIVFAGVMGFQDGVDYLLRALSHMIRDLGRSDFFCYLVGKGDARPSLEALVRELGLEGYVRFTGFVSDADWARYLSSADICVDPDPSNPFTDRSTMIKMMEYMAYCKPIVAFDLPEHRNTALDSAFYVRPNDELEFARAIVQLMDDPERRHSMGSMGRQRVEAELAWARSVPNLLAAYRSVFAPLGARGVASRAGLDESKGSGG